MNAKAKEVKKMLEEKNARETTLFEVKGEFLQKGKQKKFTKKVKAGSHSFAAEKVMATMGSKHKIKRRHIELKEIKELKEDGGAKRG